MRSKPPASVFGRRLREARLQVGIPQDKLGVMVGIDEGTASARISRYETGAHGPQFEIAAALAKALRVPTAYLYCDDDELAALILAWGRLPKAARRRLRAVMERQDVGVGNT